MSRRAVILSAVPVSTALCRYVQPGDFVVACDAGYRNAERLDLRPDLIVGDFDSAPQPKTEHETIVLPHVKDDTDTQYAAHWLLEHGYDEITLLGALGGARLEHTLANLSTGLYLAKNGVNVLLANERSELRPHAWHTPHFPCLCTPYYAGQCCSVTHRRGSAQRDRSRRSIAAVRCPR